MSQAIDDVVAERQRQKDAEGWTPEHDDEHTDGSLAAAASCYAAPIGHRDPRIDTPVQWPKSWDASWWKPKGRRRNLVRAAALLIAEIERLDRAEMKVPNAAELSGERSESA